MIKFQAPKKTAQVYIIEFVLQKYKTSLYLYMVAFFLLQFSHADLDWEQF